MMILPNLDEEIEIIRRVLNKDDLISIEHCQHGEPVNPYHLEGSVLNHTALVLKECYEIDVPKDVILAAIFHDIGKPETREIIDKGDRTIVRFHGHDYLSALKTLEYLQDESIIYMVLYHMNKNIDLSKFPYNDKIVLLQELDKRGRLVSPEVAANKVVTNIKSAKKVKQKEGYECVLMFGLPCSGKTTLVEKYYKDYFIVSRDEIIYDIMEKYKFSTYNDAYQAIQENKYLQKEVNKNLQKMLKEAKNYKKIAIDMTLLSRKRRRGMMNTFPHYKHVCNIVLAPFNEIIRRNENRNGKNISYNTLVNMIKSTNVPIYQEGFDDIRITVNK